MFPQREENHSGAFISATSTGFNSWGTSRTKNTADFIHGKATVLHAEGHRFRPSSSKLVKAPVSNPAEYIICAFYQVRLLNQ